MRTRKVNDGVRGSRRDLTALGVLLFLAGGYAGSSYGYGYSRTDFSPGGTGKQRHWQYEGGPEWIVGVVPAEVLESQVHSLTYHFIGVSDDGNPHDLQPFFQKTPYAQLSFCAEQLPADVDVETWEVNGEFFLAVDKSVFSFRPHLVHVTYRNAPGPSIVETWRLDIGCHLRDELKVTLPGALAGYLSDGDFVDGDMSVKELMVEYVRVMGGERVRITADYFWVEDNELFTLGWTYYPTKELGIGLALSSDGDGVQGAALEFGCWFAGAVLLRSHTAFGRVYGNETMTVGFTVGARF